MPVSPRRPVASLLRPSRRSTVRLHVFKPFAAGDLRLHLMKNFFIPCKKTLEKQYFPK